MNYDHSSISILQTLFISQRRPKDFDPTECTACRTSIQGVSPWRLSDDAVQYYIPSFARPMESRHIH